MEKQNALKKLDSRKKMFEAYLNQMKTSSGKKGIAVKKAAK
ncbi:MAG: hypothetical protein A4E53_02201 [Pelotomaculum sp. PtaB.Bin104]|nr:MAG: hypothetical protein A4E53_02201 [Pelotomaculum sp. PtaB.Bin104]